MLLVVKKLNLNLILRISAASVNNKQTLITSLHRPIFSSSAKKNKIRSTPNKSLSSSSLFAKFAKPLIVSEVLLLVVAYLTWSRMNNSQDFRLYMKENFPSILEVYYVIGEKAGHPFDIRTHDRNTWAASKSKKD